MANPDILIPGNCYFHMGFIDENLFVPEINTYIYIEKRIDENGSDYWLFQDAYPYFFKKNTKPEYLSIDEDMLYSMIELKDLINNLKELEDFHPIVKDSRKLNEVRIKLSRENSEKLEESIKTFIINNNYQSLTITIKYREDGFSLTRRDTAFEIDFFIHWKKDTDREKEIRKLFINLAPIPNTDYLSQHGRVRVLLYPLPFDSLVIVKLSRIILAEIYKIKANETLSFHYLKKEDIKTI